MASSSLILLSFFLLFSSATCFNITRLLGTFPAFSTYNDYLTQTHLFADINSRQTITVLAVANGAMSSLSGKSSDIIKKVMSLHVVLDYYDIPKLQKLSKKTAILTTLFQTSGLATDQLGFLNVTDLETGEIVFGSAVKGSPLNAKIVKSVAAQPYNISVLQINSLVYPPGIENSNTNSSAHHNSTAPASAPTKSPAPSAHSPKSPASPSPKSAAAPVADAPDDAAEGPSADAPTPDAPADKKAPSSSPSKPPVADAPAADGPGASDDSSGKRVTLGICAAVVMVVVTSFVALL